MVQWLPGGNSSVYLLLICFHFWFTFNLLCQLVQESFGILLAGGGLPDW